MITFEGAWQDMSEITNGDSVADDGRQDVPAHIRFRNMY